MPRLAMEGWEGWRRALLIRWRRWRFLRGDTELDRISLMKFVFMVILLSIKMVQLNVQDGKIAKK